MRLIVPLVLLCVLIGLFVLNSIFFPPPMTAFQDRREMMDTWVSITVYDRNPKAADAAIDAAYERIAQVEHIASIFDSQAEAFKLNESGRLDDPSPELWQIVSAAKAYFSRTEGTFDITVEPLLELWQYKEGAAQQFWELSEEEQKAAIAKTMTLVGADRIDLIDSPTKAIMLAPGMKITLGGIAKGYAVDQGLEVLKSLGIEHGLIDAGGDIGVFGGKPGGGKWELALRNPDNTEDSIVTFEISDGAIATSGNYERHFDPAAEVGHIMDPRTGYPSHSSSSASVIAPTCMQADALATAVFVLGPHDGIDLVNRIDGVEALVIGYEDPQQVYSSTGVGAYEE